MVGCLDVVEGYIHILVLKTKTLKKKGRKKVVALIMRHHNI